MAYSRVTDAGQTRHLRGRFARVLTALGVVCALLTTPVAVAEPTAGTGLQEVLLVSNNWAGTVTVLESTGDYDKPGVINVIPDKQERLAEIYSNPVRLAVFLGVRHLAGGGTTSTPTTPTRPRTDRRSSCRGRASAMSSRST